MRSSTRPDGLTCPSSHHTLWSDERNIMIDRQSIQGVHHDSAAASGTRDRRLLGHRQGGRPRAWSKPGSRWSGRAATHHALTGREGLTFVDLDVSSDASVTAAVEQVIDAVRPDRRPGQQRRHRLRGRRRGALRRAGPEGLRRQRPRRHPDDEGRAAAHARPGRRAHREHLVRRRARPAAAHGGLRRVQARARGLLGVGGPRGPRVRRPRPARRARTHTRRRFDAAMVRPDVPAACLRTAAADASPK